MSFTKRISLFGLILLFLFASVARASCIAEQKAFAEATVSIAALDRQPQALTAEARKDYLAKRDALRARQAELAHTLAKPVCRVMPPNTPPPPPSPNAPDVIIQAAQCFPPDSAVQAQLAKYLASALAAAEQQQPQIFTNPSSQFGCIGQKETIGIWFSQQGTVTDLDGIDILSSRGALLAVQMPPAAANSLVGMEWAQYQVDNPPKNFSYGGYDINYDSSSNKVKVTFHVSASAIGKIDVNGTIDLTDTLSTTADGFPQCPPTQVDYNSDANEISLLLGFFLPMPFSGVFIDYINAMAVFQGQSQVYGEANNDLQGYGLGCAFAEMVPTTVLTSPDPTTTPPTPAGKLIYRYRKVSVAKADGMTFYTDQLTDIPQIAQPRNPAILEEAPFVTYVYAKDTQAKNISARLKIQFRDLQPDANGMIAITWSAQSGKIASTADSGTYALATFGSLPQSRRSIGMTTQLGTVTITGVDVDNVKAGPTTFPVFATVEPNPPPPPPKNSGKPKILEPERP